MRIRIKRELYERAKALGIDVKAVIVRALREAIEDMETGRCLRRARETQELPNGAGLTWQGSGSPKPENSAPVAKAWWAGPDLNRGPPPRKGGVLPG